MRWFDRGTIDQQQEDFRGFGSAKQFGDGRLSPLAIEGLLLITGVDRVPLTWKIGRRRRTPEVDPPGARSLEQQQEVIRFGSTSIGKQHDDIRW